MPSDEQIAIGKRLKAAANAAGLTSAALGEAVGVEDGTIRGWWRGRGQPTPERLRAYAAAVGESVDWLLSGIPPATPAEAVLIDAILGWLDAVQRGSGLAEAFAAQGIDPAAFPGEIRDALVAAEPSVRADLAALAGEDWFSLSEAQRRAIAEQIRAFAAANRKERPKEG